ncbi:Stp1/IreP family PP2C-type Ser/Thr phosphatase [Picosynechococcus sp. PCC 8807]|uniref:Stp1/IreP family PP2C-type Ser/Thr phosphatase n=1 Tax=Picosynechococcus sp. PCC 8807 TaxID=195248 RepID=UPI000810AD9E|nr:Stp1/IreP family PP2C-type Ser/Thr phosphatase [Picosynechococcus sp. PCC 8807]ANV89570.1 serine/threonine protein phosphatase [Picosynechococcus sp. PCC 8807]
MKCRFTGQTDPGLVRSANQDSYYCDPDGRFFIVADGMGGHAGGEEASRIAVETIQQYLEANWESPESSEDLLETALIKANEAILADQLDNPARQDMGTTAVMVLFRGDHVWRAHVGDSRLYSFREDALIQVTGDHTWVSQAVQSGDITAEQAKVHPWRHVLSQCLGRKDLSLIDLATLEIHSGDRLLLCSDGLTEEVDDSEIQFILSANDDLDQAAAALIETAKDNGGSDNVTVVLVQVEAAS